MSLINIYIPMNAVNAGRWAGISAASAASAEQRYSIALYDGTVPSTDILRDKLRTGVAKYDNNIILKTAAGIEIEFIDAKIDIIKKSVVKSTPLIGRDGTVKEYINQDDYNITITGNLYAGNLYENKYDIRAHNKDVDRFPYEELQMLNYILSENRSLEIESQYLIIFEINQVVFQNADFNQSKLNYFNVMPFTLKFLSDMDYNFLINE